MGGKQFGELNPSLYEEVSQYHELKVKINGVMYHFDVNDILTKFDKNLWNTNAWQLTINSKECKNIILQNNPNKDYFWVLSHNENNPYNAYCVLNGNVLVQYIPTDT